MGRKEGGGVVGGTVATIIALGGDDSSGPSALPGAPLPPVLPGQ